MSAERVWRHSILCGDPNNRTAELWWLGQVVGMVRCNGDAPAQWRTHTVNGEAPTMDAGMARVELALAKQLTKSTAQK